MDRIHFTLRLYLCLFVLSSCIYTHKKKGIDEDSVSVYNSNYQILLPESQLHSDNEYNTKGDELFDDFLYNYLQDSKFRRIRTIPNLKRVLINGSNHCVTDEELDSCFQFMSADYITSIYNNDSEKYFKEDTALTNVSVERIDLIEKKITTFNFNRVDGAWMLHEIRMDSFMNSDLADFLLFYSEFTSNSEFQKAHISASIHISMVDPNDDTQIIDGFISHEQWNAMGTNSIPEGIISNVRYGQKYLNSRRILIEKTGMGNGLSETYIFIKGKRGWSLVGYEN